MVLFGGYHTAERFFDDDRLTAHFPGPGSYALGSTCTSPAEGATRYARPLVEDGVVKPDGTAIGFRERDSWVRGAEGPKGLTSLSVGNAFICPATYSTEPCERAIKETAPAALINTLEPRYLSPSTRCLTPDHERAAKGVGSPGPGTYYPSCEAWDFAPPSEWNRVNKAQEGRRPQRNRRCNAKEAWGESTMPRPPNPSRAAEAPSKEERAWLSERRGPARRNNSPRCMWINGVSTARGLQSWGDIATNTGPIHVGYRGDCSPQDRPAPRRRRDAKARGPVHSCEARATSPGFREVRYVNRDLTRRGAGTSTDTPGPGQYNIRAPLWRGTTFAGPRPKCSKAATVRALLAASASTALASGERAGQRRGSEAPQVSWPSPPPAAAAAVSQRLSTPLMGRESPGPAYNLPSDFDLKLINKKTFHPPGCGGGERRPKPQLPRERGRAAAAFREGRGTTRLARARRELLRAAANSGCTSGGPMVLGVPVKTSVGRGFLLRIRADGMTFVRLPWGVLYTREALTRGSVASATVEEEDPAVPTSRGGGMELPTTAVQEAGGVDATPSEDGVEGGGKDACDAPQPTDET